MLNDPNGIGLPFQVESECWDGVHPKYFDPQQWGGINDLGGDRYKKFIQLMVRRISRNKSNVREIVDLGRLICSDSNWEFMRLALPFLPDFDEPQ